MKPKIVKENGFWIVKYGCPPRDQIEPTLKGIDNLNKGRK